MRRTGIGREATGMLVLSEIVLIAAVITAGLIAGLFYAYSCSVMPGLGRADARTYVTTMREINVAILNGWFALTFGGAPLLAAAAAALHFRSDLRPALPWIIAGFVLLMAMVIVTMAVNVPLNNAIEAGFDGDNTDFEALRANFEGVWERWNLVRTLAGIGGFGALVGGLIVHFKA